MAKKNEKKRWGLYFIAALLFLVPLGILASASCTMSNGDLPDNGNTTTTTALTTTTATTTTATTTVAPTTQPCPTEYSRHWPCWCLDIDDYLDYLIYDIGVEDLIVMADLQCRNQNGTQYECGDDTEDCWLAVESCESQSEFEQECMTMFDADELWGDDMYLHRCPDAPSPCGFNNTYWWMFCFSEDVVEPNPTWTSFYDPGIGAPLETDVPLLCVGFIVLASILILVGYFIVRK